MKADTLYTLLGPVAMMNNRHALSAQHKCLYLSPSLVMAKSSYGQIEIDVELTGLTGPVFIETATFMGVLNSLPPGEELVLKQKGDTVNWKCGAASGKLASAALDVYDQIGRKPKKSAWPVQLELAEALDLGAISCDNNTLAAIGMYGIVIDNRGAGAAVYSCDNVTISACYGLKERITNAPELMTLAPEAASLLSATMKRGNKGKLEFFDGNVYYRSENTRLLITQSAALSKDISALLDNFKDGPKSKVIAIPPTRIASFVQRVNTIADNRKDAHVTLKVEEGRIALSFSTGIAASDEYYMAEGLGKAQVAPIALKADRLARALRYVQSIDIAHLDKGVVLLRGESPTFRYMIAGNADNVES